MLHRIDRPLAVAVSLLLVLVLVLLASPGLAPAQDTKPAKPPPVDPEKLKALIPETAAGLKRHRHTAETHIMSNAPEPSAKGLYANSVEWVEGAPRVAIDIIDYGPQGGPPAGMIMWVNMKIDVKDEDGHSRTLVIQGHPALDGYMAHGKSGDLSVFVAGRFMVNISTANLPPGETVKIAETMNLAQLAELK